MSQSNGELSHFEQLSAQTPRKMPVAILVGTLVLPLLLVFINWLAPTEAVKDMKNKEAEATQTQVEAPDAPMTDEIEEI